MHRVLSFQMGMSSGRGFGESSEFVTKRMCFSFIFFFGFLALLGGFLLGRMSTERNVQLREERKLLELAVNVLEANGLQKMQYDKLLEELQNSSFEQSNSMKKSPNNTKQDDRRVDFEFVKIILSNSSLFQKVVQKNSTLVATLLGSREPDRWVVFSVNGDGTILALQLVKILGKMIVDHKWKPQRTIIFCFSDDPSDDSCRDIFPKYLKSNVVAYLAIHGNAIQKKGCLVASGSDIMRSVVLGVKQDLIFPPNSKDRRVFESCELSDDSKGRIFMPRLDSDIPHTSLSFKSNDSMSTEFLSEREMLPYRRILMQIIGLSIWKLSDSVTLPWDSKDFENGVETALKMINSLQFSGVKEKILSTTEALVNGAESLNERINSVEKDVSPLAKRMTNDLLMDLDKALLCSDVDYRSKTDLALVPEVLSKSQDAISSFLSNMLQCYDDALRVLQEG